MASIKQVQSTLQQDEANTVGSITGKNVIQLCEQRTNQVRTKQRKNDAARKIETEAIATHSFDISPNKIAGRRRR